MLNQELQCQRDHKEDFLLQFLPSVLCSIEETFVDPTTAMDPSGGVDDIDPTVTPPLSLHAMMESFMTI